ncbi:glycosyltransferase family 2 protein [Zooshikella harenae]|uniref:Glycosyltransferase family 2 protein n=1 Tax=Zooshikella harenae TaxID=2827238 RepID=A0ABS5Z872_9GAMM|nr:glycosyltransferase family 2 protein [Zooshikella harenae]MBU2710246.1 glycosyltransferase family 2 protein [Zooshikella harenae]
MSKYTLVIPAKNEYEHLGGVIYTLQKNVENQSIKIIVVNDGSTDNTSNLCEKYNVIEIKHNYSKGNGAAIKTGLRNVDTEHVILMDADGQHNPDEIKKLIKKYEEGYDMVIGARSRNDHASLFRKYANIIYNKLTTWIVGHKVKDLTSGFRVANTEKMREFIELYPNGFSYPTTSTIAFFRAGYTVGYERINVEKRRGEVGSHINLWKDGVRFFIIIFKIGVLYSPMKIFFPLSMAHILIGVLYYLYTFINDGRFTNMSALLLSNAVMIFLIGLVAEQITMLIYRK